MKRNVLSLLLALMVASPALAGGIEPAPAAEELTRLLTYFLDGASRNDVAVHDRFWAEDLVYTRSAGVRMGKPEILDNARSGPTATPEGRTAYKAEDIRIQQYGDTAVVAFRLVGTTGAGEKAEVQDYLNTGTFVKRNGEWRAVAWQATTVPAGSAVAPPDSSSDSERAAVDRVVADYIGLYTGPTLDRWQTLFHPAVVVAFPDDDGSIRTRTLEEFVTRQKNYFATGRRISERLENIRVNLGRRIARVSADFIFVDEGEERPGKLGLHLAEGMDGWKIVAVIFSYNTP